MDMAKLSSEHLLLATRLNAGMNPVLPGTFSLLTLFLRLLAPNYYPESACGERTVALGVGITYDIVEAVLFFAIFEQIFCPDNDNWGEIEYLAGILAGMGGIGFLWY